MARPGERLVGDLDGVAVAAEQPRPDQALDDRLVLLVGGHRPSRGAGAHRVAGVAGHDEAQHEVTQHVLLAGRHPPEHGLGRLGHRLLDAAGGRVAGHGQGVPLAPGPRLAQHVGQQRQGPGGALDLADEQVDQPRLEPQARLLGGSLDGPAERVGLHRPEEVQAALDQVREGRVPRHLTEAVGPQGQDQRTPAGDVGQRGQEGRALGGIHLRRQHLLALVDDEHVTPVGGSCRPGRPSDAVPAS